MADKKVITPAMQVFTPEEELKKLIAEGAVFTDEDSVEAVCAERNIDADDGCREDRVTEDDVARENGFWVDEDGHWRELDEDDEW